MALLMRGAFRWRFSCQCGLRKTANAHFQKHAGGWSIHKINPEIEASISNVTAAAFEEYAQNAERNCPVSRALSGSTSICEPSSSGFIASI